MRVQEILISHHSHTDIGYTHEQPVLWELQARYIEQAMDLIEETMDWPEGARLKWTCEVTAPVLYWLKAAKSRDVERFAEHARAGYIEVTALFCNLTPLCNLEELHRLLLPVARLRRELGIPVRTAMNSDVNGLPWPLVDLLLDSGITGVTMAINEHMGGAPLERPLAFWWVGPSGRKILAYNGLHYGFLQLYGLGEDPVQEAHARIIEWLESHPVANRMPVLYVQNTRRDHRDNNGPSEKLAPFVREWNEAGLMPRLRLVTPVEAMERLAALPAGMIQEVRGDWHDYWNFGAGSSVSRSGSTAGAAATCTTRKRSQPCTRRTRCGTGSSSTRRGPISCSLTSTPGALGTASTSPTPSWPGLNGRLKNTTQTGRPRSASLCAAAPLPTGQRK